MATKTLPTPTTHPRGYWTGRGAARRWMVLAEPSEAKVAEQVAAHKQAVAIAAAQQAVLRAAWDACTPAEQAAMTSTLSAAQDAAHVEAKFQDAAHRGDGFGLADDLARSIAYDAAVLHRAAVEAQAAHHAAKAPLRAHIARLTHAA